MAKTVAELLAAEARELTFHELPPEVIHEVKRQLLDTLGCGFGGYVSQTSGIVHGMIEEIKGPAESTIFGSGIKTSCLNATLANGIMLRHLDYTGLGYRTKEARDTMGHHGEAIPSILAVGERQHSTGEEIITAIVLAYELLTKIADAVPKYNEVLDQRGYVHETMRTPCAMALVAGKLIGLSEEQMANAVAVAGVNLELGIMYWCEEEVTMVRNLRFPLGAYNGILGAFLARRGFKGPLNIFEGHHGLSEVVTGGEMDLEKLRQPRRDWTILNTWLKNLAVCGYMQGSTEAAITLAKKHDIKAEDVAKVLITTTARACDLMANPEAPRYPETSYTADHNAYYCIAIAILDRAAGPAQFSDEKLRDPKVRELTDKVSVASDPSLSKYHAPGIVEITTKSGEQFKCQVLEAKGHPMNPMSDADIEEKFRVLTGELMSEAHASQIVDTVYNLEKLSIDDLVKLFAFSGQAKSS